MCECAGQLWLPDPGRAPVVEGYQRPPAPRDGLIPCPECNADGSNDMWPPQPPPIVQRSAQPDSGRTAPEVSWVDVSTLMGG